MRLVRLLRLLRLLAGIMEISLPKVPVYEAASLKLSRAYLVVRIRLLS